MVIGVDAGALSITDDRLKVGVYRVTKNALAALATIDKSNNYRLYSFEAIEEGIVEAFDGRAKVVQLPKYGWQRVWLPLELKKHPVDGFLGFAQALPSVHTLCDIGFIYDLGFLYEPKAYGTNAGVLQKQTDSLVTHADHIITISQATRADILSHYGKPSFRRAKLGFEPKFPDISVAYPGVDSLFSPAGEKYIGPNPYFLFVGSLNKAKDIPTLIEAFAGFLENKKMDSGLLRLSEASLRAGMTRKLYDLYLIGGDYWPDGAIDALIHKLHLKDRVKKMGFVPDEALPSYYRGAVAFVTTALREGFCLPAAEAMACGTPVVALDRGALKEVVGEGGIVVSLKSKVACPQCYAKRCRRESRTSGFAGAMERMMEKQTREKFAKRAIEQAKKYRWEKFAQQILE